MTQTSTHSANATDQRAEAASAHDKLGAVFTRRWIVDMVLDIAGYTATLPLARHTALEPACGSGAFVAAMAQRLLDSCRVFGDDIRAATGAIVAVDIDHRAVAQSRAAVEGVLIAGGESQETATMLSRVWVRQGDFLTLAESLQKVRWVVGNPPYVRLEDVGGAKMLGYRSRWTTMTGRADLYVGFIEAGLDRLVPGGSLTYICADRWMRNQYGTRLRHLVEKSYSLDACIQVHSVDAFEERVAAYPAIIRVSAQSQGAALVCEAHDTFDAEAANRLLRIWRAGYGSAPVDGSFTASWMRRWFDSNGSWPSGSPDDLALIARLESEMPTLEATGARVSVGVATGADDVYIAREPGGTERDRLLKIITARDVTTGQPKWGGKFLVNPWGPSGLVALADFPGMAAYLDGERSRVRARSVARRDPSRWWRTIDRVDPRVASKPKLLIPDLKDRVFPVLDTGEYYPSHSLYYITSEVWDLEVLGGVLMSDVANLFVSAYSVRMSSGYLRVSAQYLRRVRVPAPDSIDAEVKAELAVAFRERDFERASRVAASLYHR
ncbi:Eco57I restriction-modification methylase domain-containing protein [Actinotalea ferrariae]|uniref:Eco57I restriction-modification methylase domain-containing protein n=1 Tax=Actinotalea ferrariae TaxID=1386098 RepID=UPI001C8B64AF|nr:Eco57I restriction-modification methylase domain-containing protein [Actinotalea ferrariae]MBX9245504.1 Eco57I restriction-modification methylase domain-containing protein [Actinotalea ferrariae]